MAERDDPSTDEHPRDAADRPTEPPPTPAPGPDPYPGLLQYQFLTPRAPLAPGALVWASPVGPQMSTVPPIWGEDPSGRHQLRWWDGSTWTVHVADDGVAAIDPLR